MARPSNRLSQLLLVTTVTFALLWVGTTLLWLLSQRGAQSVANLEDEARQELVQELLEQSPGVFQWAWFEPRIAYTLRPNAELEAWGGRFRSNEVGYRTAPLAKAEDVLRIVFLGDSWTFGMGVERAESYPEVVAELANERDIAKRYGKDRVEAWTLALPGYNTFNFTAAFWYHVDALQPDAVVVGISANDNHSSHAILPNGSSTKSAVQIDDFGDPHPVIYSARRIDSYRYAQRWRQSFELLRDLETRLAQRGIPLVHLYVGRTRGIDMQARIAEAGLRSPFVIVPLERTKGRWSNKRWGHGTPEANRLYASYVYQNLAETLDWPLLETPELYRRHQPPVPAEPSWQEQYETAAQESSRELFATEFRPSRQARIQALGDFAARTGLLGRAATVLVRSPTPPGSDTRGTVVVSYRTLDDAAHLYPLELTVSIPAPEGASTTTLAVEEGASGTLELLIPTTASTVLDVQLVSSRIAGPNQNRGAASLWIESIEVVGSN